MKIKIKNLKISARSGFTLVEMMVAIAVFSIVMVTAMSALLNVVDANQKAQAIKTAINNVNFALESISKDLRVGSKYSCLGGIKDDYSCGDGISYTKYKDESSTTTISYQFIKKTDGLKGRIQRKDEFKGSGFQDITSQEVDITDMKFYLISGIGSNGQKLQPRVVITVSGEAGVKEKIKTTFDLQTSVSQRSRNTD